MHLSTLSDEELAHHADVSFDPLTATDLQVELLKRFTAQLDESAQHKCITDFMDQHALDASDVSALLVLLEQFGATDAETLSKKLQRAATFKEIADEAGDVIQRLNDLTTATQSQ